MCHIILERSKSAVRAVLSTNTHQRQRTKFSSRGFVHPFFTHRYASPCDFLCLYCLAYPKALKYYMLPTRAPDSNCLPSLGSKLN